MTKAEAINAMYGGKKVTHRYFTDEEYIYMVGDEIYSEDGVHHTEFWKIHYSIEYQTDWELFEEEEKFISQDDLWNEVENIMSNPDKSLGTKIAYLKTKYELKQIFK